MFTLPDGFSIAETTDAVNGLEFKPGLIGSLGVFNVRGVRTRNVTIDSRDGLLMLVGATEPGAPAQKFAGGKGKTFVIRAPRHRLEGHVSAHQIADARAFGGEELKTLQDEVGYAQLQMVASMDLTIEHALLGAIRGEVVDGQTGEVLYSLYDQMGVAARADVDFALDDATTDLEALFDGVRYDAIADGRGFVGPQTAFAAVYGRAAWGAFKGHAKVQKAWERFQDGSWTRDRKVSFDLWGFKHAEYVSGAGVGLADDEIRLMPISSGPASLYQLRYAPAETFEGLSAGEGLPRYSWVDQPTRDRLDITLESNPVAFCRAPRVLRGGVA